MTFWIRTRANSGRRIFPTRVSLAGVSVALPGAALDVVRETYRLIAAQPVSLSGMVGALLLAGTLSWTAAAYALRGS